jgi:hypothetical protein
MMRNDSRVHQAEVKKREGKKEGKKMSSISHCWNAPARLLVRLLARSLAFFSSRSRLP